MQTQSVCRTTHASALKVIARSVFTAALMAVVSVEAVGAQSIAPKSAADSMRAILRARAALTSAPASEEKSSAPTAATKSVSKVTTVAPIVLHTKPAAHVTKKPAMASAVATPAVVTPTTPAASVPVTAPVTAPVTTPAAPKAAETVRALADSTPIAATPVAVTPVAATPAPSAAPNAAPKTTPAESPAKSPAPAATSAPTAATTSATTSATTTSATTTAATAAAARIAEVGFGTLKFDGLLQMQYGASNTKTATSFRIRRAEMKVSGKVSPKVSWAMMFDVSKALSLNATSSTVGGSKVITDASVNQSSRLMQDALLTLELTHTVRIDAGQFRLPLGAIGSTSSSVLETIERPMFQADRARGGTFGDVRDVGFVVRGAAKQFADYWVGAFNGGGESMNTVDSNNQKSLVGRVTFRTPVNGLRVGASGLLSGFEAGTPSRRDRIGGEAIYTRDIYLLRAEVMDGADGTTNRAGGFFLFGVRPSKGVQIISRIDAWDPDVKRDNDAATARATEITGGSTWFLAGDNAKLQLNVSHRWFANNATPAINQILVNLQASW